MFKLNSRKYADMIESYKKMENLFEEEKQYLLGEIEQTAETMEGSAVSGWKSGYIDFFGQGAYAEAMEAVKELRTSMEEMQPLVNRIVAEGLLFADQLDADEMIFPGSGEVSGDEWIQLDEAYVGAVKSGCDQIEETRESLEKAMADIRELCDGIVDIGEEAAQFEEANKALKRVQTFREAFEKYVYDVRDLDESLRLDFAVLVDQERLESGKEMEHTLSELYGCLQAGELKEILEKDPLYWTDEENRIASAAWTTAVEEGDTETIEQLLDACRDEESGRVDYHRMGVLREYTEGESREILSALMGEAENLPEWTYAEYMIDVMEEDGSLTIVITQDVLLEEDNYFTVTMDKEGVVHHGPFEFSHSKPSYDEYYYETAAGYLEKDEEGRYAFESFLKQDAGEVGEKEKEILSLLYQDKCLVVETALSRENREGQFEVTERFVEGMFRYQVYLQGQYCEENAYMDEGWRTSMLSYLEDDSSFAGQTLMKLGEYKEKKDSGWREHGADALDHVIILPRKAGLTLDLEFHPIDARNKPEQASIYISSEDRAAMYVKTLDPDTLDRLALLGYGRKEIIDTYLLAESVTDEDFIDCVMKAEYRDAFRTDPEELGDSVKLILPKYAAKLCLVQDEEYYYPELELFVNSMLYQDEGVLKGLYHADAYMALMVENGVLWQVEDAQQILTGKGNREESRNIMYTNGLWESLYYIYCIQDTKLAPGQPEVWYSRGECMLQIKNLWMGKNNGLCYNLVLCSPDGSKEYRIQTVATRLILDPSRVDQENMKEEVKKAKKGGKKTGMDYTVDVLVAAFGIFNPELAVLLNALVSATREDFSGTLETVSGLKCFEDYKTIGGDLGFRTFLRLLNLSQQASERSSAVEKKVDEGMLSWFYSALTCEVKEGSADMGEMGGGQIYLSEYINNYDVLENIRQWNKEGCTFFVNLKELAQFSEDPKIVAMSQDDLRNAIKNQITKENGESSFSRVEQDAMLFLLLGESGGTEYSSILDIDEELFLDSVLNLDEVIGRAINFARGTEIEVDLRKEWLNLF